MISRRTACEVEDLLALGLCWYKPLVALSMRLGEGIMIGLYCRGYLIETSRISAFADQPQSFILDHCGYVNLWQAPREALRAFETLIEHFNGALIKGACSFCILIHQERTPMRRGRIGSPS